MNKELLKNTFKGLDQEKFKKHIDSDPKLRAFWKSGKNKGEIMQSKNSQSTKNIQTKTVMNEFS